MLLPLGANGFSISSHLQNDLVSMKNSASAKAADLLATSARSRLFCSVSIESSLLKIYWAVSSEESLTTSRRGYLGKWNSPARRGSAAPERSSDFLLMADEVH